MAEQELTPMMVQYLAIKENYKNEVVFFRLGDFYEMFNEDAVEVSRLLNLTLTHRANQPMCGIPYHASKIYIARLLRFGKKIVICEQVGEIPKGGKGITERKVVEIITPGTAVESEYLDGYKANYLAALCMHKARAAFSFIDVTTSSFKATSWPASQMQENFAKELNRCSPRELLLPNSLKANKDIQNVLQSYTNISVSYYPDWDFNYDLSFKKLTSQFNTVNLKAFGLNENDAEIVPAGFLLDYLEKTTNANIPHVNSIQKYFDNEYLMMDDSSRRNLEITENMRDGTIAYSLFECVNHTKTAMGGRLLRNWLLFPLTNRKQIEDRQVRISTFYEDRNLLEKVKSDLSQILDVERLAGRIAMDKAHAKDLQALKNSLTLWMNARSSLEEKGFAFSDGSDAKKIIDLIENSIDDDPATVFTEGRIIKEGWSEELDHWKKIQRNFNEVLEEYAEEERGATGIQNLKIKNTGNLGYFIEVSRGKLDKVPSHFIMKRTLVNADRYTTERLQQLEESLNESGTKIIQLEHDLFIEVRNELKKYILYLQQCAREVAYTDVTSSFAEASVSHNWVRPEISDGTLEFVIEEGRHPVVEQHLPRGEFVPNSLDLYGEKSCKSFALITGPNMAGKSTFLRQNALIALLAQTGCFVPAKKARIGIVDRIFCRVGASDNLAKGESTFLVEMTETARILRSATERSLVIMDEVGRGTSTEDGLSIAWAVSEHLLNALKCKTLFATHYHELTRLEHDNIKRLCMAVSENVSDIVFLRKVIDGASENSYGIHVARLAGIPSQVIERAQQILEKIQIDTGDMGSTIETVKTEQKKPLTYSGGLFSEEEMVINEILSSDVDNMTPMAALQLLSRWKNSLSGN